VARTRADRHTGLELGESYADALDDLSFTLLPADLLSALCRWVADRAMDQLPPLTSPGLAAMRELVADAPAQPNAQSRSGAKLSGAPNLPALAGT
jgi:hypothetical protein